MSLMKQARDVQMAPPVQSVQSEQPSLDLQIAIPAATAKGCVHWEESDVKTRHLADARRLLKTGLLCVSVLRDGST